MSSVVITGYGIVLRENMSPGQLFDYLSKGSSLICEDERLKSMGITGVPSAALSYADREFILNKVRKNGILLEQESIVEAMAFSSIFDALEMGRLSKNDFSLERSELFFANNKLFPSIEQVYKCISEIELWPNKIDIEKICEIPQATEIFTRIGRYFNLPSSPRIYSDACTAGMSALSSAFLSIRHGYTDLALVCASEEASHPMMQLLFKKVGALYNGKHPDLKHASRAFDKGRAGCVLADASACIILESKEHALARKVRPLAEIKGMFRESEAYKMTSSEESGVYYRDTMAHALLDANMTPADIDHINAHGTSTVSNDQTESRAIALLFGDHCPPVISTKSALGHSLAVSCQRSA